MTTVIFHMHRHFDFATECTTQSLKFAPKGLIGKNVLNVIFLRAHFLQFYTLRKHISGISYRIILELLNSNGVKRLKKSTFRSYPLLKIANAPKCSLFAYPVTLILFIAVICARTLVYSHICLLNSCYYCVIRIFITLFTWTRNRVEPGSVHTKAIITSGEARIA